jgi:prohibitin 2
MAKYQQSKNATPGIIAGVVIVVAVVLGFMLCTRVVQVGHIGIVTSFGKIIDGTLDPGLHFVMPWHSVVSIDCRVKNTSETTECYSKDLQQVTADVTLLTVLTKDKAIQVYSTIGLQYLDQVKPRVFEIMKQHVAKYEAETLIENREKVRDEVLKTCQERLRDIVDVQDIVIANIDFSEEYERAIEKKHVALQESLQAENELKKAKIEAEQAIETARGEAEAIKVRGEALKENPGVAQLEAIKKWDGKSPQTVVLQGPDTAGLPVMFPIK